jgi:hypothetical protein
MAGGFGITARFATQRDCRETLMADGAFTFTKLTVRDLTRTNVEPPHRHLQPPRL